VNTPWPQERPKTINWRRLEILADLALDGGTTLPIAPFTFDRHLVAPQFG